MHLQFAIARKSLGNTGTMQSRRRSTSSHRISSLDWDAPGGKMAARAGLSGHRIGNQTALQTFGCPGKMSVAKRHSKRVSGVSGFRLLAQAQLSLHHLLYLLLRSPAKPRDAGLNCAGRITVRGNVRLRGSEQDNAAHLGKSERCAHVESREDRFYRNGVGRKLVDELRHHLMDFAKAFGETRARGKTQCAEAKHHRCLAVQFDHSVAGGASQRRVEAENAERFARD